MNRLAIAACDHVLCHPQTSPARIQPVNLPPSTGWRDRLDTAEIREARAARMAAQSLGFGLQRDPVFPAERIPTGCGCPTPVDGMLPACYWTGDHTAANGNPNRLCDPCWGMAKPARNNPKDRP